MNHFFNSAILSILVVAVAYLFMRLTIVEKEIKSMRNRAPPVDLASAVWKMANTPPVNEMVHFEEQLESLELDTDMRATNDIVSEDEESQDIEQAPDPVLSAAEPEMQLKEEAEVTEQKTPAAEPKRRQVNGTQRRKKQTSGENEK